MRDTDKPDDNPTPPGRCACGFGPDGDCPLCDAYPWDPPPEQAQTIFDAAKSHLEEEGFVIWAGAADGEG